jgi:hypothetical protein
VLLRFSCLAAAEHAVVCPTSELVGRIQVLRHAQDVQVQVQVPMQVSLLMVALEVPVGPLRVPGTGLGHGLMAAESRRSLQMLDQARPSLELVQEQPGGEEQKRIREGEASMAGCQRCPRANLEPPSGDLLRRLSGRTPYPRAGRC